MSVTPWRFSTLLGAWVLLLAAGCGDGEPVPADTAAEPSVSPDIVLITLDTTRRDHLGVYGYDKPVSPHLDDFAAGSDLYLRAYANSSWTVPTHASMFTGLDPTDHGARLSAIVDPETPGGTLGPEAVTLAELLAARGYATGAFIGALTMEERFGLGQGFQLYDADFSQYEQGRPAHVLTAAALRWLQEQQERPIFLVVNYFDPHKPYRPPEPCYSRFAAGVQRHGPSSSTWYKTPLPEQLRLYDAEICFMDSQFHELMEGLKEQGRFDHALIAVVADHGEALGEHGRVGHGRTLYEPLIQVPLMVKRPGQLQGRMLEEPFEARRLFHMLLRETGVLLPQGLPPDEIDRSWILSELMVATGSNERAPSRAVIRWPWKLVQPSAGDEAMLFDLVADPGEETNLWRTQEGVREELETLLAAWLRRRPGTLAVSPAQVDPELQKRLRALGYVN